ncbi:MAG: hypothetical protein ACYCZO_09730, partial [Daejeonella sp.]
GLLYAFKNNFGFWQVVLFRVLPAASGIAYCKIATSSIIELSLHPEATRVQKLFQYDLPIGGRSVISKDLLDLIQQTIHDAIIPFSLQDQAGRYGYDRFLTKVSLGLDFKLRRGQKKQLAYLHSDTLNGKTVNIYLFKLRFDRQHEQTTRNTLNQLYFKKDRHIVFLSQGMAIGELGADFIEFSAGLKHLRNHLLVSLGEVSEIEIESLRQMLAAYLAENKMLQRINKMYNEELTIS